ncbi:uncharacterized protein EI90DRAFT_1344037 [Cantharellus anzutake]|uniref:uncharacterized protein n=1 Tax=Cantharellus anzutake TaxID=1750568 RepID=UPI00190540AA|nr:uncharacterized protein EI90DRAFT_1344037 [Cantharellus anzutake]KAF8329780.1 hypothetical protein EI90DRAFT_1344037 [Cantharellus anzutake]
MKSFEFYPRLTPFHGVDSVDYLNHSTLVCCCIFKTPFRHTGIDFNKLIWSNHADCVTFLKTSHPGSCGSPTYRISDAPVPDATSGPGAPDIELVSFPATYSHVRLSQVQSHLCSIVSDHNTNGHMLTIRKPLIHLRPESQGSVTVQSGSTLVPYLTVTIQLSGVES